jgi:hypothetical protein
VLSGAVRPVGPGLDAVPPGPELAALLDALPLGTAADGTLVDAVAGWERVKCWVEARQAAALSEFAHRRPDHGGARDAEVSEFAADEIALALHVARGTAERRIHFAVTLTGLGLTWAALRAGRIGLGVAHRIVDALADRPGVAGVELRAAEAAILADADGRTPGQVGARIAHTLLVADPAAAARHTRAVADRAVGLWPERDGMARLWALLPADDAVLVMENLRGQAAMARVPGDGRSTAQRLADALVDLHTAHWHKPRPCPCPGCPAAPGTAAAPASGAVPGAGTGRARRVCTAVGGRGPCTCGARDHRHDPESAADRGRDGRSGRGRGGPLIRVVVAAGTLLGLDERPGELAGYGPIPAEVARRLAADPDGTWQRILTDPASGALLDVGRTAYRPPAALAEHVRARDRTCRFPGCRMPAERCDLDHVRRYPDGPTSRCNLCTECRHHHRLKHDDDWHLVTDPHHPDVMVWTSPAGKTYTTEPRPPLEPT